MSTVLIVEDSQSARDVMARILRLEGFEVLSAADAFEAKRALDENSPDVVLLDVMMPQMDGMDLLAELRRQPRTRDLPVIIVSALSDEDRRRQASELGADYLVKSLFTYDDLINRVNASIKQ